MNKPLRCLNKVAGFSLVEVALAMMVMGVGVLSVMGVFNASLVSAKKIKDESQMACFADYVLESCRMKAAYAGADADWNAIANGSLTIDCPAGEMWVNSVQPSTKVLAQGPNTLQTVFYIPNDGLTWDEDLFRLRYTLNISVVTNSLKRVDLVVRPGYQNTPLEFSTIVARPAL